LAQIGSPKHSINSTTTKQFTIFLFFSNKS
jgi:hypothetical protein